MKKILSIIYISGLTVFALSCEKANKATETNYENYIPASFGAYVSDSEAKLTKTTYLGETAFNWVGDEVVSVNLITNSSGSENQRYDFYAEVDESDKAAATFYAADKQGEMTLSLGESGTYSLGHYAFYPGQSSATLQNGKVLSFNIGTVIKTSANASNVNISGTFKHSVAHPMRVIPLIGENDGTGNFSFHAATGILKITVSNIDERLAKVQLYAPGQKITGTFGISTVDEKTCYVMGESTAESENKMTLALTDRTAETELPFYFPVLVGTLNSGFQIRLLDANDNILRAATCSRDIPVARNCISEMTKAIPLPDEDFSATIIAGGKSNAPEATVNITKDATSVKVVAAASEAAGLALIEANDAAVVSFGNGETKSLAMTNITASGTNYIVAQTYKDDVAKLSYSIPVYLITAADVTKYVKTHTLNYGQTTAGEWKYGTLTFELSDDLTKGQLILSDIDGMTSVASKTRLSADHPLWTAMGTWLAHGNGDYAYSADRVSDGNTYYGVISDGRLSFAANINYEFFNYSVDGVSGHTAKIIIFSNDGSASDAPQELAFDISDTKLTLAHDFLVARWIGWYLKGSTVTNSGGKASKPLAQKDGNQRPYISLE